MIGGGLSKPPPSASRPPHRIELTIVAQGLADFRLSTAPADFARLSLKLSLSRRRDASRPRGDRQRSRYCIARIRSESCARSSSRDSRGQRWRTASSSHQACTRGRYRSMPIDVIVVHPRQRLFRHEVSEHKRQHQVAQHSTHGAGGLRAAASCPLRGSRGCGTFHVLPARDA